MNRFILYHHKNRPLARYLSEFSSLNAMQASGDCEVEIISFPQQNQHAGFAELPASLRRLLFFAKPDVVICLDDGLRPTRPIFAVELSTHVPARDHWMQRFINLVGPAQVNVPGVYIMPFNMMQRENFTGTMDFLFFFAYDRVMEIHQTPFYIAEWESSDGQTLNRDEEHADMPDHTSQAMQNTFKFLNLVIESAIHGRDFSALMRDRIIVDLRNVIRGWAYNRIPQIRDFRRLTFNMPAGDFLTLDEVNAWLRSKGLVLPTSLPDRIVKRSRNLIFVPQSDQATHTQAELRATLLGRIQLRGGDPYLGMPLAFDYIFCRLGPTPHERDTNLIIDLSVLSFSDLATYHREVWANSPLQYLQFNQVRDVIPTYTMHLTEGFAQVIKNFLRVYAFAADMIVFSDGVLYF
jgi:hypothetical protein